MDTHSGEIGPRRRAWASGGPLLLPEDSPRVPGAALRRAAAETPDRPALVAVDPDGREHCLSFAALLEEALRIAGGLAARGAGRGDPVIFQLDRAADFVPLLWACLLGGQVAVPVAVASVFSAENANARKLHAVWETLGRPLVVADAAAAEALGRATEGEWAGMAPVLPEALRASAPPAQPLPEIAPEDPALLLFTSGSTGRPKGVVQRHGALIAMAAGTARMNGFGAADTTLNWMPLDHVGAIAFLGVLPMWLGATQVHVPTRLIVERPPLWLDLVSRHRAAISWAPNFAFALVTECAAELGGRGLDLSCMRFLVNAGEQVTAQTVRAFLEVLAPFGLPADALRPAFGMSETCSGITWSGGLTVEDLARDLPFVPLGGPIPGAEIRITGEGGEVLAEGETGRLELKGLSVTQGYHADAALNAEAFTPDGWFRSGDLGFILGGELHVTGREKEELVVNGKNIPAHEIEASVEAVEGVATGWSCAFAVREPGSPTESLVVAFVPETEEDEAAWPAAIAAIRSRVARDIGLAPAVVLPLARAAVPRTGIGKIQRGRLRRAFEEGAFAELAGRFGRVARQAAGAAAPAASEAERRIAAAWAEVLNLPDVGREENFFDLGGHSLLLIKVHGRLESMFGPVPLSELFAHPTVAAQARFFAAREAGGAEAAPDAAAEARRRARAAARRRQGGEGRRAADVAVIGMACRFPGADTVEAFWRNLCDGVESIRRFDAAEVARAGIDPRSARSPAYVAASPALDDVAGFDAGFFGYSDREAETMDPQHRHFLECCWEAFESAGYDPLRYPGSVGLYAGASMNTYLLNNVLPNRAQFDAQDDLRVFTLDSMGGFQLMVANDKDYLNTRVSYRLNLRGPSINLQTACSTGLVVIHQAVQSLLAGECDMALAGTSSVQSPEAAGHLHREGMIVAPDGHCRAFDARAGGTIFGSGVGAVLLKRLEDALRDGDRVLAVIKGSAVNNDGLRKVGYMAPSEAGESEVAREALDVAGVDAATIGFVEAHGTGTEIGDPIEVASLTRAFRADTDRTGFCALGSVKTNVGHLQISSGIVGFMKAVLALHHRRIPPTLHFERPNPAIDFARTPFFVNTQAIDWPAAQDGTPRRAAVNSLGIGGTNAHVVLEEAPEGVRAAPATVRPCHVLALSARGEEALRAQRVGWRAAVEAAPAESLEDLCYTANVGRHHFEARFAAVFATREELLAQLDAAEAAPAPRGGGIAFMFTGQGAQHAGMARELYAVEPVFRAALDRCAELLRGVLDVPLLSLLHPEEGVAAPPIDETGYAQPALFAVEYALAQLWQSWGIRPAALIGHSVGEYVAACVAGVFTLEEALRLIAARGRLMQALPREEGAMAAVLAPEAEVAAAVASFADRVAIAAVNGPRNTVISGARDAVAAILRGFEEAGVQTAALRTSHAFHSPLMRPALDAFRRVLRDVTLRRPVLPLVSNLTGAVETELFTDPESWVRHVVEPVRFLDALRALEAAGCATFLEIGPRPVLSGLVRAASAGTETIALPSLRPGGAPDCRQMLESLAALYRRGAEVDWPALYDAAARRRVGDLPRYPFQHRRHWLEPPAAGAAPQPPRAAEALHPLVHRRVPTPGLPLALFEAELDPVRLPVLAEHRVFDRVLVAGAAHISMLLGAAALLGGGRESAHVLSGLGFAEPLVLAEDAPRAVQAQFTPEPRGGHGVRLLSHAPGAPEPFQLHVTATLDAATPEPPAAPDLAMLRARCPEEVPGEALYRRLAARRIALGPAFSWLRRLWTGQGEAVFEIAVPEGVAVDAAYQLHPGLVDSLLQPALLVLAMGEGEGTHVPVALERFAFHRRPAAFPLTGHARRRAAGPDVAQEVADIIVLDATGACVAEVRGFEFRRLDPARLAQAGTAPLREALYRVAWQALPLPAPAGIAAEGLSPVALMAEGGALTAGMEGLLAEVNGPHYRQQSEDLEILGLGLIVETLRAAGAMPAPGARLSTAEVARALDAAPEFLPVVGRLLRILEQDGRLIEVEPGRWEGVACPELPPAAAQQARILARHGARAEAELTLLTACGERLGEILRGRADPLEALFPGGDLAPATRLYQESAGFRALNTLVGNIVQRLAETAPAGQGLRVLEIGAGTGATTHHVLGRLDPARTTYAFTDVSNLFLLRAREKFAGRAGMEFRLLDIERDPAEQGFAAGGYDMVLAANVLHATRRIAETLAHARALLRPGGHLVLLEVNLPTVPVDLTFGLLEGWWRFADHDLRPDYPLLSRGQWLEQMRAAGFDEAAAAEIAIPTPGGLQSVLVARAGGGGEARRGAWAILGEGDGLAGRLAEALRARGAEAVPAATPEALAVRGGEAPRGIVSLAALDDAGSTGEAAVALAQGMLRAGLACPVHLVTRGAQAVPAQAAVQGLGRVLFQEHPEFAGSLIDLPAEGGAGEAETLAALLAEGGEEREVAMQADGTTLVPRLSHAAMPAVPAGAPIRGDGAYLITGGLGGIGLRLAAALAEAGARDIVLLGRSAPGPEAAAALAALERPGLALSVVQADVADEAALARVLDGIAARTTLRGVFHLAGVLQEGLVASLAPGAVAEAMRAKLAGALALDRLTCGRPGLEHFVLFSSAAALLGVPGQAGYAAANAGLDALARQRRARGEPALAIGWGRWSEVGMVAAAGEALARQGYDAIAPDAGIALLLDLLAAGAGADIAVLPMRWDVLLAGMRGVPPMLAALGGEGARLPAPESPPAAPTASLAVDSGSAEGIEAYLAGQVRQLLGGRGSPDPQRTLTELGLDSLMSIDLRSRIARDIGVSLPLGALVETGLARLARDIHARLGLAARIVLAEDVAAEDAGEGGLEEEILL